MSRISQQVLPLLPADAAAIGPLAGLVENDDGGVVFINGQASFAFDAGDETERRLAAVQLVATRIATAVSVAAGFGVTAVTLWRWRSAFATAGVAGLLAQAPGPKGPSKLTEAIVVRIGELHAQGLTLAAIGAQVKVDTATVRVALGRRAGSAGWQARHGAATSMDPDPAEGDDTDEHGDNDDRDGADAEQALPVLPEPEPRTTERALAHAGLRGQAPVVFTTGGHLPLAGLLLVLPTLETTGLLDAFGQVFGRLCRGFYGLRATVMMMVFLALSGDPRAEGATRIRPADLGRVLGLDRAPEVNTIRRKLGEMAGHGLGADIQAALAASHAAAFPEMLGFLHVDGHTRIYTGKRNLPKTHIARLHMAAHAMAETWIADTDSDPLLVVTAIPGASLASELIHLVPGLRAMVGPYRKPTVVFDRGGWSTDCLAALVGAGFNLLTYRKAPYDQLPTGAFQAVTWTDPERIPHRYRLFDTTIDVDVPGGGTLTLRQVTRLADDGAQIPILTSNTTLAASAVIWRMARRWRQENYFKYARQHFALDALDSYADIADDPSRIVPNPAKRKARDHVEHARAGVAAANRDLAAAIGDAVTRAGRPGAGGLAIVDPVAGRQLDAAHALLDETAAASRAIPARLPLAQVRPDARLLDAERKLITHAIRMSAYNAESVLARMLRGNYARADDEARALLREAFTLSGDITTTDGRLHVRLDPATAPRRTRALQALCQQLTATETIYPGTDLKIVYAMKEHPKPS